MRQLLAAAALCAAGSTWAQVTAPTFSGTLTTDTYSTTYSGDMACFYGCNGAASPYLVGNAIEIDPALDSVNTVGPSLAPFARFSFGFVAAEGYAIQGFDVTFDLSFSTQTYTYVGGEYPPRAVGTIVGATASLGAYGQGLTLDHTVSRGTLTTHIDGAQFGSFMASLRTSQALVCPPGMPGPGPCGIGGDGLLLRSLATLDKITIAPHVAAIPEPETWVLMVAGLCAIGWAHRRRSTALGAASRISRDAAEVARLESARADPETPVS